MCVLLDDIGVRCRDGFGCLCMDFHAEIGGSPFAVCGISLVTGSTFEPGDRLHRV